MIRTAREGDAEAVVALWTEAYFREGEGGRATPYARADFDATAAAAAHLLVAEHDGAVVGVVALLAPGAPSRTVAGAGEAELARLVVAAGARRRGVGRALVERCAELARAEGWDAIALWSRPYQAAGHRLYESLGYARAPERDSVDATGFAREVFRLVPWAAAPAGRMASLEQPPAPPQPSLRRSRDPAELDLLEPLWNALQEHHVEVTPELGPRTPKRSLAEAWRIRRGKYERWLGDPDTFFIVAEVEEAPAGYAFVTVGPPYASWNSGERLAELETLSVLPRHRGAGVGAALIEAAWDRLAELGVEDMQIVTTATNSGAKRFYERRGFDRGFDVYYGKRPRRA